MGLKIWLADRFLFGKFWHQTGQMLHMKMSPCKQPISLSVNSLKTTLIWDDSTQQTVNDKKVNQNQETEGLKFNYGRFKPGWRVESEV